MLTFLTENRAAPFHSPTSYSEFCWF